MMFELNNKDVTKIEKEEIELVCFSTIVCRLIILSTNSPVIQNIMYSFLTIKARGRELLNIFSQGYILYVCVTFSATTGPKFVSAHGLNSPVYSHLIYVLCFNWFYMGTTKNCVEVRKNVEIGNKLLLSHLHYQISCAH